MCYMLVKLICILFVGLGYPQLSAQQEALQNADTVTYDTVIDTTTPSQSFEVKSEVKEDTGEPVQVDVQIQPKVKSEPDLLPVNGSQNIDVALLDEQDIPSKGSNAIDTMNVAGEAEGNWLYKRYWWERAGGLYDKITHQVKGIFDLQNPFFTQRTELDQSVFDEFYKKSGFDKGVLETTLDNLNKFFEEKRKQAHDLTAQEREFLTQLEAEQEQLAQLRQSTETISKLDVAVDQAIALLNKQTSLCRSYEEQALDYLREIERELSDKKAKELYYQMRVLYDNIVSIENYIKDDFTKYFETLGAKAREHSTTIITTLTKLKERGIDLRQHMEAFDKKSQQDAQLTEKQAENAQSQDSTVLGWLSSAWNTITGLVSDVYSWVVGLWSAPVAEESSPTAEIKSASAVQDVSPAAETKSIPAVQELSPATVTWGSAVQEISPMTETK